MACTHPARAIFGAGSAPAMLEGYSFTKCVRCWEERDLSGRVTLPASAYTERPMPWSRAAVALGYGSQTFTEAVGDFGLSTDQTQTRSTAA